LYYVVKGASHSPIYAFYPSFFATDALNLVVPTPLSLVGGRGFTHATAKFTGNISEQVGYLGIPILVAVVAFAAGRWRAAWARLLIAVLGVTVVASLGPTIRVAGSATIPGPWRLVVGVPLVRYILPSRLMMYAALLAGLAVALWLAGPDRSGLPPWARWTVAALAVTLLLPNPAMPTWHSRIDSPPFFADGLYRQYLHAHENLLIIPYSDRGYSMLWQVQAGFAFDMAEGYVSVVPPPEFAGQPILKTFYDGDLIPGVGGQLRRFLHDKGVTAIVVEDGRPGPWSDVFSAIDPVPVSVGGVTLYRVPPSILPAAGPAPP
jgi:hypothetical protein